MSNQRFPSQSPHGYMPQVPQAYAQQGYGGYAASYNPYMQEDSYQYGIFGFDPNMYSMPMGRGRGGYYPPMMPGGRGGFREHRKQFVGGTLETQRQWERQTNCCFFLQGKCKFDDACRFLHEENSDRPCKFGQRCKIHGVKNRMVQEQQQEKKVEPPTAPVGAEKPTDERDAKSSTSDADERRAHSSTSGSDNERITFD